MKFILATLALAATAFATPSGHKGGSACKSDQTVICKDNGSGGLFSLGNIAPGALGSSCSNGNIYCCSEKDVNSVGLINLDVNAQCSLNDLL